MNNKSEPKYYVLQSKHSALGKFWNAEKAAWVERKIATVYREDERERSLLFGLWVQVERDVGEPAPSVVATPEEIAEIRARRDAATPGPYGARIGSGNFVCTALASEHTSRFDEFICDVLPDYVLERKQSSLRWEANREFLQHSWVDITTLLDVYEAQRLEIERLKTELARK